MDIEDRLRAVILSTIVRDFSKGFWADARTAYRQGYADVFQDVAADPNLVDEQRQDKLYQDRHFRMEHLLKTVALRHGLPCTSSLIVENNRHYVYVTQGAIGLTQAYVPVIGAMPKAAKFRDLHATINTITRQHSLLGDEPPEAFIGKEFYGVLTHNPVGSRFTERDQHLGMLQFCVPTKNNIEWAAEFTIEEILTAYEARIATPKKDRGPTWKPVKKTGDEVE